MNLHLLESLIDNLYGYDNKRLYIELPILIFRNVAKEIHSLRTPLVSEQMVLLGADVVQYKRNGILYWITESKNESFIIRSMYQSLKESKGLWEQMHPEWDRQHNYETPGHRLKKQ